MVISMTRTSAYCFTHTSGFQKRIDHALEIARYLAHKLSKDDRFICVTQPQYTNVCFWYLPPALRGLGKHRAPHMWRHVLMESSHLSVLYAQHDRTSARRAKSWLRPPKSSTPKCRLPARCSSISIPCLTMRYPTFSALSLYSLRLVTQREVP